MRFLYEEMGHGPWDYFCKQLGLVLDKVVVWLKDVIYMNELGFFYD